MTSKRPLKKSPFKLGIGFIVCLSGLLILARLWRTGGQSLWPGRSDFSWVEQRDEQLRLNTYLPEYGRQITWILPGEMMVETSFGAGKYRWNKVYELGELDGRGGRGLARTTQTALGLAVKGFKAGGQTNLSWLDWLKWRYLTVFKARQKLTIDLNREADWLTGPLINELTFSQRIAAESLSLALVGGADLAKVLTNHGLEVVSVTGNPDPPAGPEIWLKNPELKSSRTVSWLVWLMPSASIRTAAADSQWTDLVLVVGKDYN